MTWCQRWSTSIRCTQCNWMGYNRQRIAYPNGWGTYCPRCRSEYAVYLWPYKVRTQLGDSSGGGL